MAQTQLYKPLTGQYGFNREQDRLDTLTNIGLSTVANVPDAADIDWSLSNTHALSISANTTLTFSHTSEKCVTVAVTATGAYSVTWPGSVRWPSSTAPAQTSTGTDLYQFHKVGLLFYGHKVLANTGID